MFEVLKPSEAHAKIEFMTDVDNITSNADLKKKKKEKNPDKI